jgi:hypothetical protein
MRIKTFKNNINMAVFNILPWMYTIRNATLVIGLYLGQHFG